MKVLGIFRLPVATILGRREYELSNTIDRFYNSNTLSINSLKIIWIAMNVSDTLSRDFCGGLCKGTLGL